MNPGLADTVEGGSARGGIREEQMAQGNADECGDVGVADLRHGLGKETPSLAVTVLQSFLLACSLIGLTGSLVMLASKK
jgi:hypothetical protein